MSLLQRHFFTNNSMSAINATIIGSLLSSASSLQSSSLSDLTSEVEEQQQEAENKLMSIRFIDICVYSLFFLIGAPANVRVLLILVRNKLYSKTRHHQLLLNLAVADTIVCLIMLPTEVGWRITLKWLAFDAGCRIFQFFRVFGLYASSMVLIVISIDRYYAVVQPFTYVLIGDRINGLLILAWLTSALLSLPQVSIINHHSYFASCLFWYLCLGKMGLLSFMSLMTCVIMSDPWIFREYEEWSSKDWPLILILATEFLVRLNASLTLFHVSLVHVYVVNVQAIIFVRQQP